MAAQDRGDGARRESARAVGHPRETRPAGAGNRTIKDARGVEISEDELEDWDPMPDELNDGDDPVSAGEDPMQGPAPSG
jgi:hypothetical protein